MWYQYIIVINSIDFYILNNVSRCLLRNMKKHRNRRKGGAWLCDEEETYVKIEKRLK